MVNQGNQYFIIVFTDFHWINEWFFNIFEQFEFKLRELQSLLGRFLLSFYKIIYLWYYIIWNCSVTPMCSVLRYIMRYVLFYKSVCLYITISRKSYWIIAQIWLIYPEITAIESYRLQHIRMYCRFSLSCFKSSLEYCSIFFNN